MRESSPWTVSCGLWGGVRVYLHASLLVVVVFMIYLTARMGAPGDFPLRAFLSVGILLASLFAHEIGHSLAAWRLGGGTDLVVLGPLGGMHLPHVPRDSRREVTVALAGPLFNLIVMAAVTPPLVIEGVNLGSVLLHPLYPGGVFSGSSWWVIAGRLTFWINWLLVLANLIPAGPLDGGSVLRSVLWPVMGYRGAIRTVGRTGMLVALVLCLLALLVHDLHDTSLVPPWLPLVLLSIYLCFSARMEMQRVEEDESDDDLFGYDFSQGYTSLEDAPATRRRLHAGPLRRWLRQRREFKQLRLRQIEAEEERRVDEVLVRVKELGIDALSPEERALLHRVSARYRSRLQS